MRKRKSKPKDKKVLFKTKDRNLKKIRNKRKRKGLKQKINIRKILFFTTIVIFLLGIIFGLVKIFSKTPIEQNSEIGTVLGLEDIPIYPNSIFLYSNNMDNQVVKDMLASGQSAYEITDRSSFGNVKEYYANELISKGWDLVLDIKIGEEDKKYGQYWINSEKGLRIYSKFNDIWYEYITIEEAKNGLSNRISNEIEIDMLLAGSDNQELLPDYPWQIKIPKEYLIRYEVSEFEDLRAVTFQKILTGSYITIYPVAYWGSKALDYQLNDYLDALSTETEQWSIINTYVTTFRGNSSLSGVISSSSQQMDILILKNDKNFVTYILSTEDKSDPLYQYIIDNIKYLGEDS
ncbi:TPA: hypothetical protein DEP90_02125 [Patescibacteria group bacterium]|nr:hypothetical protein [Patescibacteria group bacterium]